MCPCADCIHGMQQKILDDEFIMNSCNNCYNFWWNPEKMCNIPDGDYPIEGDQQCLKLTYDLLKKAVTTCHQKIVDGDWTDTMAKSYLNRHCLNNNSKNEVIENANNVKKLNHALMNNQEDLISAHQFLKEENLDKYQMWRTPAFWDSCFELEDFMEPIMHQFF